MATNEESWMREKLEAPMPLIGVYVTLASLACAILIAADLIHAFRSKKLWFPSNYFSLNATTLAFLSVPLKLPSATDRLAKISSLALTSTCIAIGSMSDGDILINITAVSILIATVAADVSIEIIDPAVVFGDRFVEEQEINVVEIISAHELLELFRRRLDSDSPEKIECPIHPSIRHHKCRRFLYNARGIMVYLMLVAQICAVLFYNLVLVISCCVACAAVNMRADLPDYMLPKQVEQVLEASRRKKASNLIEFLRAPTFKGHRLALPNVEKSKADQLVEDVRDGLFFVEVVEESFYSDGEWKNIRKAADFWLRVDLFRKWQEFDLAEIRCNSRDFRHAVEWVAREGERIASGLKTDEPECPMFNPENWKPRIIAANAMYRIGTAILRGCDDEESAIGDEEFLARLIGIIADASDLLGRSEEILNILVDRVLPAGLNEAAAAYVEEWRAAMLPEIEVEMVSSRSITPSEGSGSSDSSGFEGEFDSP
ncbi:hypothetical protein SASPL_132579 [Salvia splendens]|uniref:Uncharacterized protein n=1 Tax=Salvia splendens TaxID=180675 RepID=A0A8X8WZR4_SALSN|nr:hypothetical protein SASPL_132579 [Salvia splendens]